MLNFLRNTPGPIEMEVYSGKYLIFIICVYYNSRSQNDKRSQSLLCDFLVILPDFNIIKKKTKMRNKSIQKRSSTYPNIFYNFNRFMHFILGTLNQPKIFDINMTVDEVFHFHHLESVVASKHINYPETQQYYLYGDKKRAYISHIITKYQDFHQVFNIYYCHNYNI